MSVREVNHYRDEQFHTQNYTEGNTSDDSELLMGNEAKEDTPLIADTNNVMAMRENVFATRSPPPEATHCHVPDDAFDYGSRNRLIFVLIICVIFMVIEIVGGIISNSTAVMTDAAHMTIDVASFLISLAAMYLATKRPTKRLSFGYIRAEVLGALLSVLTIWLVTGILVYMAIQRCIDQTFTVQPVEMIVVAACGVFFNIIMFFVLHANVCGASLPHHGHSHGGNGHGHSHGGNGHGHSHASSDHSHSHGDEDADGNHHGSNTSLNAGLLNASSIDEDDLEGGEKSKSKKTVRNINIRAAIIHVIGDFVQSVGVLCAAILIKIKPEYKLADPICTFIFSVLVLITTITIMRDIVLVLMEGVPSHISLTKVVEDLLHLPGVRNAHSLHIWALSMQRTALSVHIAIDPSYDILALLNQAQEMLRREHSIARTTIQVELYDETVMTSCESCRPPRN